MNPRIENLLQISADTSEDIRQQVPDMDAGFDDSDRTWEIIVKTAGSLDRIRSIYTNAEFTQLLCGYWIVRTTIDSIEALATEPEIIFIEKPKALYFELYAAKSEACVNVAKAEETQYGGVTGKGVLVAVIDSGIDIENGEFLDDSGKTRIKTLWDQTTGITYSDKEINIILEDYRNGAVKTLPARDVTGHGNEVAVIACGRSGVASDADIIIVKLGNSGGNAYIRTTQIMKGVDYCIRKAIEYSQPVAVNISYGGTYGNHEGSSIFEMFIDDCCSTYRCSICIGVGNEGEGRTHYSGQLVSGNVLDEELAIGDYEPQISIQIWKRAMDNARIELIAPTGERLVISERNAGVVHHNIKNMRIVSKAYGPGPFYMGEEIYAAIVATS